MTVADAASPLPDGPVATPAGGRVQLALNVDSLDEAVAFYTALLGARPAKLRPGYANFAVEDPPLKLVLFSGDGPGGTLNHLGVEVATPGEVVEAQERLTGEGLPTAAEEGVSCCYATQDKVWVDDPDGAPWEVYTVLADAEVMGCGTAAGATPAATTASGSHCC